MTVAFKELAGSPVETYGDRGIKAQRQILCAWEDRLAMVAELMGSGFEFGGEGPPSYPGFAAVIASQIKVEPFQAQPDDQGEFNAITSQLNSYSGQFVKMTINYELLNTAGDSRMPRVTTGTFLTYRMDFSNEYVRLPDAALQWEDDSDAPVLPDAIPLLRVPIVVHHLVWHRVTYPPWDAIRQCTGCVNDDDFLGATAETVLFDGAVAERDFVYLEDLENPQYSWRLTYVFREKAQKYPGGDGTDEIFGWNDAFNSVPNGAAGFDRLVDAAGNPMYATNDFSALFAFDPGAAP